MTDPLDDGWYDWVTANLGSDYPRAAAATRAAAEAVAQGRGFNAAADAARASWEADRHAQAVAVRRADPPSVPGTLVAATALAVGGALASLALIVWMFPPTAACNDYCPGIRNLAYIFLFGNVAVAGLHGSLFVVMWRWRAALAWWACVVLVGAILLFDTLGELTVVATLSHPTGNLDSTLAMVGSFPALVPTAMLLLAEGLHLGSVGVAAAYHWLLLHLLLVELPILLLLSTRPARRWCRVYRIIGSGS